MGKKKKVQTHDDSIVKDTFPGALLVPNFSGSCLMSSRSEAPGFDV